MDNDLEQLEELGTQLAALLDQVRSLLHPDYSVTLLMRGPAPDSHMMLSQDSPETIVQTVVEIEANHDRCGCAHADGTTKLATIQ